MSVRPPSAGPLPPGARPAAGLTLAPTRGIREVFVRFWPYTEGFRGRLALGIGIGLVLPATQAATIWMFKILVDRVLVPADLGPFGWIAAVYAGLTSVAGAAAFAGTYLSRWLAQRFALALRTDLFAHLHGLSLDALEGRPLGDVLSRLSSDVTAVRRLVVSGVTRTLGRIARIVLFTVLLFWLSWPLALAGLAVVPLFALLARAFARRIRTATRRARLHAGAMSAVAEESLGNAPLVQAYSRQRTEVERYVAQARSKMAATLHAATYSAGLGPVISTVELLGVLIVIGLGTWQIGRGHLTVGGLLAFVGYLSSMLSPVRSLSRLATTIAAASAGAERITELLDASSSVPQRPDALSLPRAHGVLELADVTFCYPGTTNPAVRNVSARVGPGEVLAVRGPSGSGKSTLIKLLLRMYDTDTGVVRLDGHDVRTLTVASLRAHIAVVLQETLVFHGTIEENIAYGRPGATPEEVRRAARMADVDEFVARLPDGYGTMIGERGRRLSGGQRQRIAIARALIRDAPVLILDEPTTGLDTDARERLAVPLRRMMAGRTTIMISHDADPLIMPDHVVELENGRVVDQPLEAFA